MSFTTDEARVAQHFFLVLFLRAQIRECVDDDAKDQVEDDDDDDKEEDQVIDNACKEQMLLAVTHTHTTFTQPQH